MEKRISVGINIFGEFPRQDLCIASLKRLASKHSNVKLYDVQQNVGKEFIIYPDFEPVYDQGRYAGNTIPESNTKMPMIRDFFDALAETDCDYFVFLNSDIVITSKIVRLIQENDYDSISVSRLAINEIESIETTDIEHSHFQVAGFDVWAVKKSWWLENRDKFPDYIYATSAWDVDYSSRMMVLGNSYFDNQWPPGCYHVIHEEKSHNESPDHTHNVKLFWGDGKILCDAWHGYFYEMINERKKLCPNYTKTGPNEDEMIKKYFKNETVYTFCNRQA
jgi:hypothetical protein